MSYEVDTIYGLDGLINVVLQMIKYNKTQLVLPVEKRKYRCVRIINSFPSHALAISGDLRQHGIKSKDFVCIALNTSCGTFSLVSTFSESLSIYNTDGYVIIYKENNSHIHDAFDLEQHKAFLEGKYYPKHGFLGTVVLFEGTDCKYKCNAPEKVYDHVLEYEYVEEEQYDQFIE